MNEEISETKYNKLVVSGGAVKGVAALGALQYMYDNNRLNNIEEYVCTSIGSMICYLLCIGYTPVEIICYISTHQLLKKFIFGDILSVANGDGLYNWNIVQNLLEKMTLDKIGKFLTLNELYELTKRKISVITYNFSLKKEEILSYENHPHMNCILAIRLSSNLPFIFSRYKYLNCYYLDGGFINNFPINQVKDDDLCFAINLASYYSNNSSRIDENFKFHYYLYDLLCTSAAINQKNSVEIANNMPGCDLLNLKLDINAIDFNINNQKLLDLFSQGFELCKDFFKE